MQGNNRSNYSGGYKPRTYTGSSGGSSGRSNSGYSGGYNRTGYSSNYSGGSGFASRPRYSNDKYNRDYRPRYQGPDKNYFIKAKEVRVIDADGTNLGVIKTEDAIIRAKNQGLDLVEISPNADPPVCRIIDFSKYLYEQKKKQKKAKSAQVKELKEFRFSPVIDEHDIEIRVKRAKEFLAKGHNVRLFIQRKGRQTDAQVNIVMTKLLTLFADYSTIETEPKVEGKKTFITFKPDGKAKNTKNSDQESSEIKS